MPPPPPSQQQQQQQQQHARRYRRRRPLSPPSLPSLALLLTTVAAAGATTADTCPGGRWLEAPAPHGHAAARACTATGAMHVAFGPSFQEEQQPQQPPAVHIPLDAVGFRHRGRWLTAAPGGGLVLDGVVVSEAVAAVDENEDEESSGNGVSGPASASGALGPSTVLSVRWRAEENDENHHRNASQPLPPRFHTNVRVYHRHTAVAFEQLFPLGTEGADSGDQDNVVSSFPAFAVGGEEGFWADKAFLTYAHNMACPDGRLFCTFAGRFHDPTNSTTGLNTLGAACGQAGGVPLVVFGDHRGGSGTEERRRELTLVLSPMDTFMAANVVLERGEGEEGRRAVLRYGVQGRVDALFPGFALSTLVYLHPEAPDASASGIDIQHHDHNRWQQQPASTDASSTNGRPAAINAAMAGWGRLLRCAYHKADALRAAMRAGDATAEFLGYYTDNGAYYYYQGEGNKTYEETLLELWDYAQAQGIPFRSLQLDSWWYYKGRDGGVSRWEARPDIFPSGLEAFHARLGDGRVPIVAHNRWWSVETAYATQNGGNYSFLVEQRQPLPDTGVAEAQHEQEQLITATARRRRHRRRLSIDDDMDPLPYGAALPLEQRFWDDLFAEAKRWGLYTYEQDWLHNAFLSLNATLATTDAARRWLRQMGRAALKAGLRIQYCMAFPRFYLQALEIPAVTQIRVSDDYGPGQRADQWALGDTALLAHSLGLVPFKDVFWSTAEQPGNPYGPDTRESKPALEAAIATLSAGPVAPGDKMGLEDREVILRSCRADGKILKPSRPLTALDAVHSQRAFGGDGGPQGMVMGTYALLPFASGVGGCSALRFDIVLAAALNATYPLQPHDLISPPPAEGAACARYRYVAFPSPFSDKGKGPTQQGAATEAGVIPLRVSLRAFDPPSTTAAADGTADGTIPLGPCGRQDFQLWYTAPILPLPIHPPPQNHSDSSSSTTMLRGAGPQQPQQPSPRQWPPRQPQRHHHHHNDDEIPAPPLVGETYGHRSLPWGGLLFLGELGKWVPVSPQRFSGARFSPLGYAALRLAVVGVPGERVSLGAAAFGGGDGEVDVEQITCVVGVDGRAALWMWLVGAEDAARVAWACRSRVGENEDNDDV